MREAGPESADHLFLSFATTSFIPPTTSVKAAVLPCPHLFAEAVCSNKPQHPPPPPARPSLTSATCFNAAPELPAIIPAAFYLVFYLAGCDVVRFMPHCQSGGSSTAACRHRAHIDQSEGLMVIEGSVGPLSKGSFTA